MTDAELLSAIDLLGKVEGEMGFLLLVSIAQKALEHNGVSVELEKLIDLPDEKLYGLHFNNQWLRLGWRERDPSL